MATHTDLCDAVTDAINAASWALTFEATRVNVPIQEIDNAADLAVVVFPGVRGTVADGRRESTRTYEVNVLTLERIDGDTAADRLAREDELIAFCESLEVWLERRSFDIGGAVIVWQEQASEASGVEVMEIDEAAYGVFAAVVASVFVTVS